jgi:3,4-dihydroxyphenylacetate 2,3-dioxygenase
MGKLALAAKVTHVPSLYLSEHPGPHHGCRQPAIDGHFEIGRRCKAAGVDTIVVLDVHWLVNAGYHVNCAPRFKGIYTSNELPHFIKNMPYEYTGNPVLGHLIAEAASAAGVQTRSHADTTLDLEYGTLVPMRYMHMDAANRFNVVSVAAWCNWHKLEDSARFGRAVREAIEERYDGTVAILASGSLSHRFNDNGSPEEAIHRISDEFYRQVDLHVVEMWKRGDWKTFTKMLPTYNATCFGEGHMHDTAMLLGALGWDAYEAGVEVVTPYFCSSGTGQITAIFPVTPLPRERSR